MRAIARRAGVRDELRVAALEVCCRWDATRGGEALRLLTTRWPAYADVYAVFEAEVARVYGL